MPDSPATVVYLVHGTWAHGMMFRGTPTLRSASAKPRWFEAGSEFRTDLELQLGSGVRFVPFLWSGANTIRARHEAAARLAEQLREDIRRAPDVRRQIVAHSHGGNVALRALELLGESIPLATLATPFLAIRRRELSRDELDALVVGRMVWSALGLMAVFVLALFVAMIFEEAAGLLVWPALFVPVLPALWRSWRERHRLKRRAERMRHIAADTARPLGDTVAQFLANPTLKALKRERLRRFVFRVSQPITRVAHEIVAVRLPRDEASLALSLFRLFESAADIAWSIAAQVMTANNWLMAVLNVRRPTQREVRWSAIPLIGTLAVMLLFDRIFPESPPYSRERYVAAAVAGLFMLPLLFVIVRWVLSSGVPSLVSVSVAPLLLSFAGVFLAPFGVELVRCGLLADAKAGSVPEGVQCRLVVFEPETARAPAWRGRHFVYDYAPIRRALARWIETGRWPAENAGTAPAPSR